ncbi:MAG: HIT domain-containing protein [Sulfurospirillaceae bacterium]|nr:HIT domain-containing protein [Sulfurospirillaceae bacterium]
MNYMYAPWREEYFGEKKSGCVFCQIAENTKHDEQNYVLYRDDLCSIVMNRYPYTPGHFMVIPHFHTDSIEELEPKTWLHVAELVQICVKALKEEFGAQGINLGMNLGKSGGAGIAEHVHYHIIPRWIGDTNFITTIGESRVYSNDFKNIYEKLKKILLPRIEKSLDTKKCTK